MMYREGIQFPPKDLGLREDVHALGRLIGEILRDQGGDEFFALVEGDRRAAIARREGLPESGDLEGRAAGREPRECRPARAPICRRCRADCR